MKTQVDENTSNEEFNAFISAAFDAMCIARNKVKHKITYDDETKELIFHYIDGTADQVQITQVENYIPEKRFIPIVNPLSN